MQFYFAEQIYQRKIAQIFGVFVKMHYRLSNKNIHTLMIKWFISLHFYKKLGGKKAETSSKSLVLIFAYILAFVR